MFSAFCLQPSAFCLLFSVLSILTGISLELKRGIVKGKNAESAVKIRARPAASQAIEPSRFRIGRFHGYNGISTPSRQVAARQAATKKAEQEETEKTEGKELCRKCRVFADSTATRPAASKSGIARRRAHPPSPRQRRTGINAVKSSCRSAPRNCGRVEPLQPPEHSSRD